MTDKHSDTPRCDEEFCEAADFVASMFVVPLVFARQLERELAAAMEDLEHWKYTGSECERAYKKLEQRCAELQAKVDWLTNKPNIVGYPWDSPYMDGVEAGKAEMRERCAELGEALIECVDEMVIRGMDKLNPNDPTSLVLKQARKALKERGVLNTAKEEFNEDK
jgi:hypothetical protein